MSKILPGCKFFQFNDDQESPIIVRVTRVDDLIVKFYNEKTGSRGKLRRSEFESKYRMLSPDGMIGFSLIKVEDNVDVLVTLSNLKSGEPPKVDVACRQLIYDFFTNNMRKTDRINYVGVCVSQATCPPNIEFNSVLACDGVVENRFISVYLDDNLDKILSFINPHKFDVALKKLYNNPPYADGKITYGFNPSIKDLLKSNNFMYDFRKTFGIREIPLEVELDKAELNIGNVSALEEDLHEMITATYVTKYSREIDTSKFNRRWLLAASVQENFENIYIVGYDVSQEPYPRDSLT